MFGLEIMDGGKALLHLTQDFEAASLWEHPVEEHQIEVALSQRRQSMFSGVNSSYVVAFTFQALGECGSQFSLVLYE